MKSFLNFLIDILPIIIPVMLTGLFTFLVTAYKYNKNKPLDKFEITYNRVIYPVYINMVENESNQDIDSILQKIRHYFTENKKYVDMPTLRAFDELCKEENQKKKQRKYKIFKANIENQNKIFRRELGYFSQSVDRVYKYLDPMIKTGFYIPIEFCFMYSFLLFSTIPEEGSIWYIILTTAASILIIVMIVQLIIFIMRKIYYLIK